MAAWVTSPICFLNHNRREQMIEQDVLLYLLEITL